jgi:nanoRNase/pAp phosphatase (c-di-AMP/oligoRNAs hydrolase)
MKAISLSSLRALLKSYRERRVLLTFHSMGDTDSIASALALQRYFKNAKVATPDFITSNSRRIMERLGFSEKLITNSFDNDAELVVLLDVNNFGDCGAFREKLERFGGVILIIDHHALSRIDKDNVMSFNSESYNSTSSIMYELVKSIGVSVDKKLANLLATGIISDSAEFKNAFPKTFVQVGELLERSKMDYPSLLLEMQHISSPEMRETSIRDLFGSEIAVKSGMLVLYGQAKVHANRLADDAIKIGADLSIFYTLNKKEVSFSARLRPTLDRKYDIHLGRIMKELAPIINGSGGGHPCAAGAYGSGLGSAKKLLDRFFYDINEHVEASK